MKTIDGDHWPIMCTIIQQKWVFLDQKVTKVLIKQFKDADCFFFRGTVLSSSLSITAMRSCSRFLLSWLFSLSKRSTSERWGKFEETTQVMGYWNLRENRSTMYLHTWLLQICPEMQANEMHALHGKHHKVSSFLKSHQNTHNSVKCEVIQKWHFVMLIHKEHWIPLACISGRKWTFAFKRNFSFSLQGIEWTAIEYFNNAIICDLIEKVSVGTCSPRSQKIFCQRKRFTNRQVKQAIIKTQIMTVTMNFFICSVESSQDCEIKIKTNAYRCFVISC